MIKIFVSFVFAMIYIGEETIAARTRQPILDADCFYFSSCSCAMESITFRWVLDEKAKTAHTTRQHSHAQYDFLPLRKVKNRLIAFNYVERRAFPWAKIFFVFFPLCRPKSTHFWHIIITFCVRLLLVFALALWVKTFVMKQPMQAAAAVCSSNYIRLETKAICSLLVTQIAIWIFCGPVYLSLNGGCTQMTSIRLQTPSSPLS